MTDLVAQLVGALEGAYSLAIGHAATYKFQHELEDVHPTHQKVLDDAKSALSAAKDGGWVAVPVEPTPQMTWAATVTADREWCYHVGRDDAKKLWAAMLAARPLPAPPAQKEPT